MVTWETSPIRRAREAPAWGSQNRVGTTHGGPTGAKFIFGAISPQILIVDLGTISEIAAVGSNFNAGGDRFVDTFMVFISTDGVVYTLFSKSEDPTLLHLPVQEAIYNHDLPGKRTNKGVCK